MRKIRLTEGQLNRIVLNTAKRLIREGNQGCSYYKNFPAGGEKNLYMYYERLMTRIEKCNYLMSRASNNVKRQYNQFMQGLQQGNQQQNQMTRQQWRKSVVGNGRYCGKNTNGQFVPVQ